MKRLIKADDELIISREELSKILKQELSDKLEELIGSTAASELNLSYDLYDVEVIDMAMDGTLSNKAIKEQPFAKYFNNDDNVEIVLEPDTIFTANIIIDSDRDYDDIVYDEVEFWYNNICTELLKYGLDIVDEYKTLDNQTIDEFYEGTLKYSALSDEAKKQILEKEDEDFVNVGDVIYDALYGKQVEEIWE